MLQKEFIHTNNYKTVLKWVFLQQETHKMIW